MPESPARPAPAEDSQATAERRRAARALLRTPLLTADGPGADDLQVGQHHDAVAGAGVFVSAAVAWSL